MGDQLNHTESGGDNNGKNDEEQSLYGLVERKVNMTDEEFKNKFRKPKPDEGFSILLKTTDPTKFKRINFTEF